MFFEMKREVHILSILFFSSAPTPSRAPPAQDLREQAKVNRLLPSQDSTNWLFQKSPKSSAHASGVWRHSHPLVKPFYRIFILTWMNDTSSPIAR